MSAKSPVAKQGWSLQRFATTRWRIFSHIIIIIIIIITIFFCATGLLLKGGGWSRSERIYGPFQLEGLTPSVYLVPVGLRSRLGWIFDSGGDDVGHSALRLWVNGEEWGPAHAAHSEIRLGSTRAFSHWNGNVHLWLPPHVANDQSTELRVSYDVRLRPILLEVLVTATAGLAFLYLALFGPSRSIFFRSEFARRWTPRLLLFFPAVSWGAIALGFIYFGASLYGLYAGYALPTAAVFDLVPAAKRLAAVEPYAPSAILFFAALGAAATWLSSAKILPRQAVRASEIAQMRLWARWGAPWLVALMVFVVSSVSWTGQIRPADFNYVSLAALVPNSDAANYLTAVFDQIQFGTWNANGSRRPLAQAFRQVTAFAVQYSYVGMLLIQATVVALMLAITASRIASWRGIWASIAFTGFVYMLARPYLFTLMTEPLGMIWSLFCLLFLIEALRRRSLPHALVALLALTLALWTRMGSMMSVPFMMLWVSLVFARANAERLRLLLVTAGVVLCVAAINGVLASLYGADEAVTGANFAYTLCGLSIGADWGACASNYAIELAPLDERAQAQFLFAKAWESFSQQPGILIGKLFGNTFEFVLGWPRFFLAWPTITHQSSATYVPIAVLAIVPGLVHVLRSHSPWAERMFWLGLWASVAVSAAAVFADDGWRNLHVTNTLLACFLAFGFSAPGGIVTPVREWWVVRPRNGLIVVAAMVALFIITPTLARTLNRIEMPPRLEGASTQQNVHVVAAGRWLTGFLVIADDAVRPIAVPSLSYSEFAKMVRLSNLESQTGSFLEEAAARVPFAFMTMPDIDRRNSTALYIAPPDVLGRRDVRAWRLVVQARPGNVIRVVEQADAAWVR